MLIRCDCCVNSCHTVLFRKWGVKQSVYVGAHLNFLTPVTLNPWLVKSREVKPVEVEDWLYHIAPYIPLFHEYSLVWENANEGEDAFILPDNTENSPVTILVFCSTNWCCLAGPCWHLVIVWNRKQLENKLALRIVWILPQAFKGWAWAKVLVEMRSVYIVWFT